MKFSKSVVAAALASVTLAFSASAVADTYQFRQAAQGVKSPIVAPLLGSFGPFEAQLGQGPLQLTSPTSSSPAAFTYASSNPAVATISGNTVTVVGVGTTTITATQVATANYSLGTTAALLTVSPAPQPAGYFTHQGVTWTTRSTASYSQPAAQAYCAGTFAGTTGWRLPTVPEVQSTWSGPLLTGPVIQTWNFEYARISWTTSAYGSGDSTANNPNLPQFQVYCVKPV